MDRDCADWLAECEVPFCIVFTKIDNRKKDMPTNAANVKAFKQMVSEAAAAASRPVAQQPAVVAVMAGGIPVVRAPACICLSLLVGSSMS